MILTIENTQYTNNFYFYNFPFRHVTYFYINSEQMRFGYTEVKYNYHYTIKTLMKILQYDTNSKLE